MLRAALWRRRRDPRDHESSNTLKTLEGAPLVNPALRLPVADRYTYIHQGKARMLDHALVSRALALRADPLLDAVHALCGACLQRTVPTLRLTPPQGPAVPCAESTRQPRSR